MSPNGGTSSSTSSSICCCSRYFRRSSASTQPPENQLNSHLEPIEIKVNGQPHLMIPHVALRPSTSSSNNYGPPVSVPVPIPLSADSLSEINLELFETARTSRTADSKLHPMKELIRMTRIEEGLEVTPRNVDICIQPRAPTSSTKRPMETVFEVTRSCVPETNISEIRRMSTKPRRAVFNEDGDITTRSTTSSQHRKETVFSVTNPRRVSIESIGVPIVTIPTSSESRAIVRSSAFSRRISSTPQMITALVAFTYACITTMFTTFTNLFSK